MCILIDRRIGSGDLINLLPRGLAQLDTLPFGDCAFIGNGPSNQPLRIGIEIKALSDACASMRSGRFGGHQLPGLLRDYDKVYVILEGMFRVGQSGELQTHAKGVWQTAQWGYDAYMYRELDGWINTITNVAGVIVKRTLTRTETAAVILNLYRWWTSKDFEQHRSHVGIDNSGRPQLIKPGVLRRVAAQLPGIGWERSIAVAETFTNVHTLANASIDDWRKIKGIGKVLARRVYAVIRGEKCDD
jgi:ERCC4-type nuclease